MVGAVADACARFPDAVLGVLPGGRGNDLARVLGIGQDPVAACAVIAGGVARKLDLARSARQSVCWHRQLSALTATPTGSPTRRHRGWATSSTPTARCARWPPGARRASSSCWTASGTRFTGYSVGACNSRAYGGGMYAAPDALLDDGLLDVLVLEQISKLRFLTRILPKVFKGTHVREPSVHVLRGRELEIAADRPFTLYADGDPIARAAGCVCRCCPRAVSVLVPADDTGSGSVRRRQPTRTPSTPREL